MGFENIVIAKAWCTIKRGRVATKIMLSYFV
jgi:hypothetical protein